MVEDDLVVVYTSVGATAWEVERMLLPLRGAGLHPRALDEDIPAVGDGPGSPDPRIRIAVPGGEEARALEILAKSRAPAEKHAAEFMALLRRGALIGILPALVAGVSTGHVGIAVGALVVVMFSAMIVLSNTG